MVEFFARKVNLKKGFTCACKTNYVDDGSGNCVFDQSICADKLANIDWKGFTAYTRFSGSRTNSAGSPAIHAATVCFMNHDQYQRSTDQSRSVCGPDQDRNT